MPPSPPPSLSLRPTTPADLPTLFRLQLDPDANALAGTKPYSEPAFLALWDTIFASSTAEAPHEARIILVGGEIVGSINCFKVGNLDHIGYWIDRKHWGRGIATRALSLMIREVPRRPLYAVAARSNAASTRVLQSCGFRLLGYHMGEETPRYTAAECATFVLD
ncbi:MAG: GNAT family N-acetyltransferase [Phycisphaeraceae bacterium]|nr:GNAT family N-acetyltransferase [Phycisphaeraceae bacterium]